MSSSPSHYHDSHEDDEDSLFGSPPPSPGRSPPPGLALPGSSTNASGIIVPALTKNVGTIALPGSQCNSELFINPLASSLSLPPAPRYPAPAPRALNTTDQAQHCHLAPFTLPSCSSSRPSPPSPSVTPKPPKQRKRKQKPAEPTFRPEIQIPELDPSAPLPAHFLRSQSALLGAAGVVGGVKPANLVHRARGATPSNPIVIDEGDAERKPAFVTAVQKDMRAVITSVLKQPELAMPSKQEILAALVKEKDIFPIIQGLIKITAPSGGSRPKPSRPSSSHSNNGKGSPRTEIIGTHATGFPMKKRKLNQVPAGAADWDIPYPFANGEGPEEYDENWRSERGKELIAQLLNLINSATKKAAVLKYMKQHKLHRGIKADKGKAREDPYKRSEEGPRVNKYYKPITATYGLPPPSYSSSRQSTPAYDCGSSKNTSRSVTPSSMSAIPSSSSAATTPGPEQTQESNSLDSLLSSFFAMSQGQKPDSTSTMGEGTLVMEDGMDQTWLDDWMKALDPSLGMDMNAHTNVAEPATSPFDFGFPSFDYPEPNLNSTSNEIATVPATAPIDNFPIDPELLALSFSEPTTVAPSPMPTSADSTTNQATPVSVNWDLEMLDLFTTDYSAAGGGGTELPVSQAGQGDGVYKVLSVEEDMGVVSPPMPVEITTPTPPIPAEVEPSKSAFAAEKEDVIRRVKERKALLEVELNKVKLHLWETTIEQGGLHHVLAHYQEKEKSTS